jgi:hypothetical protein
MHDLFEGVANYDISVILIYILDNNFLSIDHLNHRIQHFDFYGVNLQNKPPIIKMNRLKCSDLGFSASEMYNLILCLPLAIGDLIPSNCEVWGFFLLLLKITKICCSKVCTFDMTYHLDIIVKEHHELYIHLFKMPLKPKYHFLIHYGRLLRENGPLFHNWSFRFESKHLHFKTYSATNCSRINMTKSLAIRSQLITCCSMYSFSIDNVKMSKIRSSADSQLCKWIEIKGQKCHVGAFICNDFSDNLPMVYKVVGISISNNNMVSCNTELYDTIEFNVNMDAYKVRKTNISKIVDGIGKPLFTRMLIQYVYVSIDEYNLE